MARNRAYDKVTAIIDQDREDLVNLAVDLGGTPSPHGKELEVGTKVVTWLNENGIEAYLQPITELSVNAIGKIPGTADGTSLIMDAHLDTGPELGPRASEAERRIHGAWVEGDLIYGLGVVNCKGQVAAIMTAARAIKKAGIKLKGDLTIAAAAFETGAPSVDEKQGINYPGEGFGTRWLIDRGITADYALIGETTEFSIVTAECGDLRLKIRMRGRAAYTPRIQRGPTLQENPNAAERMGDVIVALREWAVRYEKRDQLEFPGGLIVPKAQIHEIRGTGASTEINMDIRLVPGANPRELTREIKQLTQDLDLECEVTPYQWSRGYIAENAETLIEAVREGHRYVHGSEPPPAPAPVLSMWRDLNAFNEVGIPSICYGAARQYEPYSDFRDRAMKIADLVAATKVYAMSAISVCEVAEIGEP